MQKITLNVVTGDNVPSFKNRKRTVLDRSTGNMRPLTEPSVKKRMDRLEAAIVCALFSSCQTSEFETDLACRKQLRTLLSGLCDDSLKVIPDSSFGVEHVTKEQAGVRIEIEKIL